MLYPASGGEPAWFEHDPRELTDPQLSRCEYFDGLSQKELRHLALQRQLQQLQPVEVVNHWHCVECAVCYTGHKCCPQCGIGIYSVEASANVLTTG